MRTTALNVATLLFGIGVAGCRPYRAVPVGPPAPADEPVRPSGVATRTFFKLPNGLGVVLEENHAAPVVAIHALVSAGAANDPAGQEGLAGLVTQVVMQSTQGHPPGQLARDVAAAGGRIGAWTSHEHTVFHAVLAAPFLDFGLGTLGEILRQPDMAAPAIEVGRRSARDALRQTAAAPDRLEVETALAVAFPGHPYGRAVLGTEATLAALGAPQVSDFYRRWFGPATTTLVIVGDFDPALARARVDGAFGSWRSTAAPVSVPVLPAEDAPRIAVVTGDVSTPRLVIGFGVAGARDRRAPALELLAAVLGGAGRMGRLEIELGRNRQLGTGARARLFSARDGGLLLTTMSVSAGRIDEAARALLDEVMRLGRERIGAVELAHARAFVEGEGAADKAALDGYARKLALSVGLAGDPAFEAAHAGRLSELDAGDLMDTAATTFRARQMVMVVILPAGAPTAAIVRPGGPEGDNRVARLTDRLRAVATASESRGAGPIADGPVSATGRDVVDYALPSGVRVLVLRDDSAPQLSVRAAWAGGVRLEDGRLAGASALLARLLPRETKTRSVEQMAAALDEIGGHLEGLAAVDSLGLRGDFLAARWDRGLELFVDCLRNPRLADEEVERERRVVLDAIRARDDDPTALAQRLFQGALYGRHPYRMDVLGTSDSMAGLTRRRLLDHYRRYYGPRGLTLAIVGAVEPDRIAAKLQALFADASVATVEREQPVVVAPPTRTEPTEVIQLIARAQARIVVGYPGLTLRDPDRLALEVLAEIMGGAEGRLAALRVRTPGLEAISASAREGVDPGYFAVNVTVRPEQLELAVGSLRVELARVVEGGVTDAEVARARRYLLGTHAVALERRGAVALAMALHGAFGESRRSYRRDVDELARVTVADVARVARRILDPRREVLAVVRPRDGERSSALSPPTAALPRALPGTVGR